MKLKKFNKNPWVLFSPFIILYVALVFIFKTDGDFGDESRYLIYAGNLLKGFYSPPAPDVDLGNGPGYSILIMPFVAMKLPLLVITLLNAGFYYVSVVLLFKVLMQFVSYRLSLIFSLFMACYINAYEKIPLVVPETLSVFLVSLIIYLLVEGFKTGILSGLKKFLILAGICIGYLVLTKPVFGYVLIFMFLGLFFLMLKDFKNINYRKGLIILFTAFIVNAPYLIYTYNLTGRVFYWSNFGGDNLYWMTTPFKGEYGSWYDYNNIENDSLEFSYMIPGGEEIVRSNHKSDYEGILSLRGVEQDDALRKIAICNIKAHPVKFLMNCISNFGRIIFNFPYTFKLQTPRTLVRLPFNGIIMVLALFCLIPTIINWRKIPFAVRFMLVFSLLYLGGSTLGSAETRMFTIIVPVLLTWISFSLQKSVSVKLKFEL